jgi:hypothetical protein
MRAAAAVFAVTVLAALAGAAGGRSAVAFCTGAQLSGTFKVVPGSAGAGNIVYRLVLTNTSTSACSVTGLPTVRLYGRYDRKALPTHVVPAFRGGLLAPLVQLAPGSKAQATARFSPDVPGTGEPAAGPNCEPVSYWLRVTLRGGGVTKVRVRPATPVCEHGSLQFSAYGPRA